MQHIPNAIPSHDDYFRENFSDPSAAASLVRLAAPPAVVALLELDKMIPLPTAQFDPDMGRRIPDLLFECPAKSGRIVVSILFEHKSSPDYRIALQFLRYILLDHEQRHKQKPVQPVLVLPILVYHGERRWKPNLGLVAERHVPEELRPYILQVPALIIDLSRISDADLESFAGLDNHSLAALLVLKHIFQGDPGQHDFLLRPGQRVRALLPDQRTRFIERTILYLVYTGRVQRQALETLEEDFDEELPMRYKTGHQLDLEDAFHKGEAKGIEQGVERGLELRTLETVRGMLDKQFDWATIQAILHINEQGYTALQEKHPRQSET